VKTVDQDRYDFEDEREMVDKMRVFVEFAPRCPK
jgi:hypothetical protein